MDPNPREEPGRRRPRLFFGWYIVLASVASNAILSAAYFQGFSALFLPIERSFGWSRSTISVALSLRQLETGIASALIGMLLDRIPPGRMVFWSAILTGIALVGLGLINGVVTFYMAFIVVSLGASGVSHAVTWPVLIARWFRRKRGIAMGLAVLGPIFGAPFLIVTTSLEEAYGWRAVLIGSGIVAGVTVSLLSLLARDRPQSYGLLPDGDEPEPEADGSPGRSPAAPEEGLRLREVLHTREFWLLTAYMGGLFMVNSAIHAHQIPYFVNDRGLTPAEAAVTLMLVFLVSGVGRIGGGYLMDKSDYRAVLAVMAVLMGASLVYLQLAEPSTVLGAIPFVVLFGVSFGGMIPIRGTLGSMMFGLRSLGAVIGLMQGGSVAAGVFGPIFMGIMFDVQGTYHTAVWGLVGMSFIMAPLPLVMSAPDYLRRRRTEAEAVREQA